MASPPKHTKVQTSIMIPWDFKEFLQTKAKKQHTSFNQMVLDSLNTAYGSEFARNQNPPQR